MRNIEWKRRSSFKRNYYLYRSPKRQQWLRYPSKVNWRNQNSSQKLMDVNGVKNFQIKYNEEEMHKNDVKKLFMQITRRQHPW